MAVAAVLGTAQLGLPYGIANRTGQPTFESAVDIVRQAAHEGYDAIDTAPAYGEAEDVVGAANVALPVYTKVRGGNVRASVETSLRRLGRETVDILFLHDPEVLTNDALGDLEQASRLVGTIVKRLGVSVYTPEQFEAAVAHSAIACVQVPLNAADRRLVGRLAAARPSTEVFARSVFLQGALLLSPHDLPPHLNALSTHVAAIRAIASDAGLSITTLLLAFVALADGIDAVVVGCESLWQMQTSLQALHEAPAAADAVAALLDLPDVPESVVDPRLWPPRQDGPAS